MHTLRRLVAVGAVTALAVGAAAAGAVAAPGDSAFHRSATYPVYLNVPDGVDPSAETVAEISTVSRDGRTLIYTDAAGKRIGFLDISDPAAPTGLGTVSLAQLGHADDQPTSVAVHGDHVLVVVDESGGSFTEPKGRVDVLRLADRARVASIDLGGQPDSIAISEATGQAVIAIENQRDEDLLDGALPQAPGGFLSVIDLDGDPTAWAARRVDLGAAAAEAGIAHPEDLEPEYVAVNSAGRVAVTLQENNGVVVYDLASDEVVSAFDAGSVTLTGVDTVKDAAIDASGTLADVPREPDAIAWVGDRYLATANEGDLDGGSRGWSVFDQDGTVVWDAGNSFERLAIRHGLYNDSRAAKKGSEPEGLAVATIDGVEYGFVASERSNFVAVYDLSDPAAPAFRQLLFTTNGPEGILPIPGRSLLAVSSETDDADAGVRASVALFELGAGSPDQPSIVSADVDGSPIGWTALGALTADPADGDVVYAASDSALKHSRLYRVDASAAPAVITDAIDVTVDGEPAGYDVEGIFKRPQGGFWLASEGATGPQNALVLTDDAGVVKEEVRLPEDVAAHVGKWGLEGVTAVTDGAGREQVYVALQRPLWVDPAAKKLEALEGADNTRVGRYDVASKAWSWFTYQLEPTEAAGDWMGLSEIVAVDADTLAVIERDKLNGPAARVKRVYTVDVPAAAATAPTALTKKLAYDALPALQARNGWTQEKLEGMTIAADGRVLLVTDNDGLKDATGETVFFTAGTAEEIFGVKEPGAPGTPPAIPAPPVAGRPATPEAQPSGRPGLPSSGA